MGLRGNPPQAFRSHQRHVNGGSRDHQSLIGAYIGGGFGAADVLLTCLKRQHKPGLPSWSVVRPIMRPGIWRTSVCLQAMKPK